MFLRQKWKTKPAPWGPKVDVISAIRRNLEALGIPYADFYVFPFWSAGIDGDWSVDAYTYLPSATVTNYHADIIEKGRLTKDLYNGTSPLSYGYYHFVKGFRSDDPASFTGRIIQSRGYQTSSAQGGVTIYGYSTTQVLAKVNNDGSYTDYYLACDHNPLDVCIACCTRVVTYKDTLYFTRDATGVSYLYLLSDIASPGSIDMYFVLSFPTYLYMYQQIDLLRKILERGYDLIQPHPSTMYYFMASSFVQEVIHSAQPLSVGGMIQGSCRRSVLFDAPAFSSEGSVAGGAFISHSFSTTLAAAITLEGTVYIGEGFIETDGTLSTAASMTVDGLIWSYSKDATGLLMAAATFVGGAYHNVVIVADPLTTLASLDSVSGTGFVTSVDALSAASTITGDGAGYVSKEETLIAVASLVGQAIVSQSISATSLEADSTVTGERTPLGSVSESGIIEGSTDLAGTVVLSVGQSETLENVVSITGTPVVEYSVTMVAPPLTAYPSIAFSMEVYHIKLKGNFRKTDITSKLETDIILTGGKNAA